MTRRERRDRHRAPRPIRVSVFPERMMQLALAAAVLVLQEESVPGAARIDRHLCFAVSTDARHASRASHEMYDVPSIDLYVRVRLL